MLQMDKETVRRYILGKQGLWPGRRWQGIAGTEAAMRAMEYLQLDPLQMIARSQDIALQSRVIGYSPGMWEEVGYGQRKFFDWGGWLAFRPMDELPYWRVVMQRERDGSPDSPPGVPKSGIEHAETIAEMRRILSENGMVSNRDFKVSDRKRISSYRGRKDTSVALYYLWRTGEVMTHHRENFERVYALTEEIAPEHLIREHEDEAVDRFLFEKEIRFSGLSRLRRTGDAHGRGLPFSRKDEILKALLEDDVIVEVDVDGWRVMHYALASDVPLIEEIAAGRVPEKWALVETDTTQEAVFLSPLDPVVARGRAKEVFDFEYVWEVYKPADKRQYGYYVLPVLWGDTLVARFDSKLDRTTNTFVVLGLWLEDDSLAEDEAFAAALGRGFARFTSFLGAEYFDAEVITQPVLRRYLPAA